MSRPLPHYLRLLVLTLAAACATVLNYRHVAVVRVVAAESAPAPAPGGQPTDRVIVRNSKRVVVRERVSFESITTTDALLTAPPLAAWLPALVPARNPLGTWLLTKMIWAAPVALFPVRAAWHCALPAFERLLGTCVAPQAP